MWSSRPRNFASPNELTDRIISTEGIEGITLTGGEPFAQAEPLVPIVRRVRAAGLSVMAFTGYEIEELVHPSQVALLSGCDIVVSGRYIEEKRTFDLPLRGSTNQTVNFLTERYSLKSISDGFLFEVNLATDGTITLTGFPPETFVE